jgi:hypothetical protein
MGISSFDTDSIGHVLGGMISFRFRWLDVRVLL